MKTLLNQYIIDGLRRILGFRDKRMSIELDCEPQVEATGTFTISGRVVNGAPDCPVSWYCYQGSPERSGVVPVDDDGRFSFSVPVYLDENLFTLTTINRFGDTASNGVVVTQPE